MHILVLTTKYVVYLSLIALIRVIPPGFYEEDGTFYQPPSFEICLQKPEKEN